MVLPVSPTTTVVSIFTQNEASGDGYHADFITTYEKLVALQNQQHSSFTLHQKNTQPANNNEFSNTNLVQLSPQTLNVLNGVETTQAVAARQSSLFGTPQLQQIANVISPFTGLPLDVNTLSQMQTALVNAGYNPQQVSMDEIMLAMEYSPQTPALYGQSFLDETVSTELLSA